MQMHIPGDNISNANFP